MYNLGGNRVVIQGDTVLQNCSQAAQNTSAGRRLRIHDARMRCI
jgi:hypothetical protein